MASIYMSREEMECVMIMLDEYDLSDCSELTSVQNKIRKKQETQTKQYKALKKINELQKELNKIKRSWI